MAAHRHDVQQVGRAARHVHRHADQSDAGLHFPHAAADDSGSRPAKNKQNDVLIAGIFLEKNVLVTYVNLTGHYRSRNIDWVAGKRAVSEKIMEKKVDRYRS